MWGVVVGSLAGTVLYSQPAPADADSGGPDRAALSASNKRIVDRLANGLFRCPDKLWPGWKAGSLGILLVDVPKESAVIMRGATSPLDNETQVTLAPVSYASLPSHLKQKRLGHAVIPWLSMERMLAVHHASSDEAEIDRVVGLVLHESFHLTGQSWTGGTFARGAHFPDDARLRYLRRRIIEELRQAAQTNDAGGVAFWLRELREKHGRDQKRLLKLDAVEGTAEYVEAIGSSIASHGCDAGEKIILEAAFARLDAKWRDTSAQSVTMFPEVEAYVIGAYSGLLLRRAGRPAWQKTVENGQPMLHLLVEQLAAQARAEDPELQTRIREEVKRRNDLIKPKLEELLASLQSPAHTVVSLPAARLGNLSPRHGFVTYDAGEANDVLVLLGARGRAYPDDLFATLEFSGQDILLSSRTPCGAYRQAVFAVPRDSAREVGHGVKIVDEHVIGQTGTAMKRADKKVPWLCVSP